MSVLQWVWSHRGVPCALLLAAAALAIQPRPLPLDSQPADAWIYAAMADEPSVFTARPWGYRILGPWVVHRLPGARGFVNLTLTALTLASLALYLYLRRLGHGEVASLAAVAAFGLSSPVAEALQDPYLCEPLAVLTETAFLLAVESGAGLGVLSLLGALAALSKEILLVLLPVVYFARRREGRGRALAATALVALPALAASLLMRLSWTPHLRSPYPLPHLAVLPLALERLGRSWPKTGFLLGGLLPLAALGALRTEARPFLRRYGPLVLAFLVLPFVAWTYDPRPGRVPFFGVTVRRLLIYALPVVLPLALLALDRVIPHFEPPPPDSRRPRALLSAGAILGALVLATLPLWGMDPYRRIEIRGGLHGPVVRAICRQTLKAAGRLERGEGISLLPDERRFSEDESRPSRIRWFLRDGWGSFPHYDTGDVVMQGRAASVLLPCYSPVDLDLVLSLSAAAHSAIRVDVNGFVLGALAIGPELREHRLRAPASALFRGDNLIGVVAVGDEDPRLRIQGLTILPARPTP